MFSLQNAKNRELHSSSPRLQRGRNEPYSPILHLGLLESKKIWQFITVERYINYLFYKEKNGIY